MTCPAQFVTHEDDLRSQILDSSGTQSTQHITRVRLDIRQLPDNVSVPPNEILNNNAVSTDAKPNLYKGPGMVFAYEESNDGFASFTVEDMKYMSYWLDSNEVRVTMKDGKVWNMTFSSEKDASTVADHIVRFVVASQQVSEEDYTKRLINLN